MKQPKEAKLLWPGTPALLKREYDRKGHPAAQNKAEGANGGEK